MKHESGIEVYLIPADGDGDSLRYPELHYQQNLDWRRGMFGKNETQAEYQARDNCCFIRRHDDQRFKIVVRFNEEFEMYSSSSIVIGVGMGAKQAYEGLSLANMINQEKNWALLKACGDEASRFEYHSIQRSSVVGQQAVLSGPDGEGYKVPEYAETIDIDKDEYPQYCILKEPRMDCASPGTLTVTVQRGNHYWLDEKGKQHLEQSKEGPRRENSFRNILGKNGRKIRRQFRVRSLERMLEIERRNRKKDGQCPMSSDRENESLRYTLIPDEDFRLKEKQRHDYRMQLQKEYLEKMAQKIRPVRPRRVRKQPKVCQCPKEHVGQGCKKRKAAAEITDNGIEGVSTPPAKRPKASGASLQRSEVKLNDSIPLEEPGTTSIIGKEALVAPRACEKCRKYKTAPKGKKWFFDRLSERWMLAPIDVADSFQPLADGEEADEETVQLLSGAEQNQTIRFAPSEQPALQQDEDNDEIVDAEAKPAGEKTWTEEADEEIVQQVIGAEQGLVPTRHESQQPLLQQDEDDQEIINTRQDREAQDALHATGTETLKGSSASEHIHGAPDQNQESDRVDSQVARIMTPTADFPATSIPAFSESPSAAEKRPGKIWTPLRFTLHLYDGNSADKATNGTNEKRSGRVERSLPQISDTSDPRTPFPRLPFSERKVWDDPQERPSESSLAVLTTPRVKREPRLSVSQSHNVIDLTGDSSSETRAFKKEHSAEVDSRYQHTHVSSEDTEDEDEAELNDLQLRHEEIQLKIRMADLKRKMKQKAAAKRQSRVKQEIIEID